MTARLCGAMLLAVVGAAAQTVPKNDCAVSGTVVNSATGAPVPRATVMLNETAGSESDAQGRWNIANTLCGTYAPTAMRVGFVSRNQMQAETWQVTPIELISGSPVTNVKVELLPEAVITGQVHDSDGDPMDETQVRVMQASIHDGKRVMIATDEEVTNSGGGFRIDKLGPGRYIVCAHTTRNRYPAGGGEPLIYPESCFPGRWGSGSAVAMTLEAGHEAHADFVLTASHGVHVRGTVTGASGMAAVCVQAARIQNGNIMGRTGVAILPDGRFDIPRIESGHYLMLTTAQAKPGDPVINARTEIEVGDSNVEGVSLSVAAQAPGAVTGGVRYEPSDIATPVEVSLMPTDTYSHSAIPRTRWDASHRTFETTPLDSQRYRLNVTVDDRTGAYIRSATFEGQDVLDHPLFVEGATGPIEIVVGNEHGGADFTVNDASGHPTAGFVMLVSANGRRVELSTGDDGHASSRTVPVGDYRVWAFESRQIPYAEDDWMNRYAGPGEKIAVTSGGSVSLVLKRVVALAE